MKRVLLYLRKGSGPSSKLTSSDSDSAMKIGWPVCSEPDVLDNKAPVAGPNPDGGTGNKEESFFDSEAWLESDNEDFYSVQGDNTPSMKASPVHQKKSLSELFCESFDSTKHINWSMLPEKQEAPAEETPNTAPKLEGRKASGSGSGRHCFPGLVRSLSRGEWRKKRLNPVHVA